MKIVSVRIDDACPQMDQEKFYNMVKEIEKAGIKGLIGVVPNCKDKKLNQWQEDVRFWENMRQLQKNGWVIAMHGFTHVYDIKARNLVARRKDSEFAGHSYQEQYNRLQEGKRMLEKKGIFTEIFFAPAHTYDRNTLKALRDTGFHYVSDGCTRFCYQWYGIKMIPCRSPGMPKKRDRGVITIVTHPCAMSNEEYDEFIQYLSENTTVLTDYKEFLAQSTEGSILKIVEERIYVSFLRYIKPWLFPVLIWLRNQFRTVMNGK